MCGRSSRAIRGDERFAMGIRSTERRGYFLLLPFPFVICLTGVPPRASVSASSNCFAHCRPRLTTTTLPRPEDAAVPVAVDICFAHVRLIVKTTASLPADVAVEPMVDLLQWFEKEDGSRRRVVNRTVAGASAQPCFHPIGLARGAGAGIVIAQKVVEHQRLRDMSRPAGGGHLQERKHARQIIRHTQKLAVHIAKVLAINSIEQPFLPRPHGGGRNGRW